MNSQSILSLVLGILQCLALPYAFRQTRAFGNRKAGWVIFSVFALLALLQLGRAAVLAVWGTEPNPALDLLYFLVPILLLIGMAHIETMFEERVRLMAEQQRSRTELEAKVKERTAELDTANDELHHEILLRKQGEVELRKSKEQYRFLFEENPQPMWIFDLESHQMLAFNSAALRNYGYTNSEFRELTARDLCAPEQTERFDADCARPSVTGEHRGFWQHKKKDGSKLDVELTCLDLVYATRPARLVLAHDVTAQKLLQKQLLQAQKMQVTTQLAGGVADNFSRLILLIESDANLLLRNSSDSASAQPLKRIAATAASAGGLTRQLMALVRKHPMQVESLDLNQFIEEHSTRLAAALGKKISVETVCRANLPQVAADPVLMDQILTNLVLNGRDAMPKGGTLTISTAAVRVDEVYAQAHEDARPGAFVCLTVSDTGCGMSPEVQARLFEPFFTTKPTGRATGLGLATVLGLVKQHAGWIEVRSQPDGGSCFIVFLPCGPLSAAQKPAGPVQAIPQRADTGVSVS
jgi:two-component system, cell cycle sensor histidine kinase and response regulator CckA